MDLINKMSENKLSKDIFHGESGITADSADDLLKQFECEVSQEKAIPLLNVNSGGICAQAATSCNKILCHTEVSKSCYKQPTSISGMPGQIRRLPEVVKRLANSRSTSSSILTPARFRILRKPENTTMISLLTGTNTALPPQVKKNALPVLPSMTSRQDHLDKQSPDNLGQYISCKELVDHDYCVIPLGPFQKEQMILLPTLPFQSELPQESTQQQMGKISLPLQKPNAVTDQNLVAKPGELKCKSSDIWPCKLPFHAFETECTVSEATPSKSAKHCVHEVPSKCNYIPQHAEIHTTADIRQKDTNISQNASLDKSNITDSKCGNYDSNADTNLNSTNLEESLREIQTVEIENIQPNSNQLSMSEKFTTEIDEPENNVCKSSTDATKMPRSYCDEVPSSPIGTSRSSSPDMCSESVASMSSFSDSSISDYLSSSDEEERYSRDRQSDRQQRALAERRTLYVGRIPLDIHRTELRQQFSRFGHVDSVSIHRRKQGEDYGFVTYSNRADAFCAVEEGKRLKDEGGREFNYSLCFGGRRQFCKEKYLDLDNQPLEFDYEEEIISNNNESEFDIMLKQFKNS